MARVLWEPSDEVVEEANITAYSRWLEEEKGIHARGYPELWAWSVRELEQFQESVWQYFRVMSSERYSKVLDSRTMPGAKWFPGSSINYAEHIFRERDHGKTALILKTEQEETGRVSWGELQGKTAAFADSLRSMGVGRGDRVAAYLPNTAEAVIAMLACSSVGAVWSSCAPDFGAQSAVDRFRQIEPKVLVAAYGYSYRGKWNSKAEAVGQIREAIPSIKRTVMVGQETSRIERSEHWEDLSRPGARPGRPPAVDPVLFGDDGASEAHRARARGDPHGALQDSGLAQRPEAGRQDVLVHLDGVDDVELPRRRAPPGFHHRAVRGRPVLPWSPRTLGPRRRDWDDLPRRQRGLCERLDEVRHQPHICGGSVRRAPPSPPRGSSGSTRA